MDTVLIPAYEPDEELIRLAKELHEAGFALVVVDDGSGPAYEKIFDQVKAYGHVLTHGENRGKGAALKTGMVYIRDHMPQAEHFITCDADGQHLVKDVIRVSERLQAGHKFVLTMRKQRKNMPLRSWVGNTLSRVVYALLTKRYLSDNQSGLRGFDRSYIDWLAEVERDKYDYEMNVLYYAAKKAIPISTVMIDAIYINNNFFPQLRGQYFISMTAQKLYRSILCDSPAFECAFYAIIFIINYYKMIQNHTGYYTNQQQQCHNSKLLLCCKQLC